MNHDSRIAIIGAGPAGMSAAWYLQALGYKNLQILEAADRVGGKCYTTVAGGRGFDLGAFTLTPGYKQTCALAKAVGMPLIRQPERKVFDISSGWVGSIREGLHRKHGMFTIMLTSARYVSVLWRHRRWLAEPGFARAHEYPELTAPFSQWARDNRLEVLVDMFRLPVKDMGYGSLDDIPTVYVLKYLHFWNFLTLGLYTLGLRRWPKRMQYGFGRFWEAVANSMDVKTSAEITRIQRSDSGVRIQLAGEDEARHYDHLIVSCQPNALLGVMDYSDKESSLFGAIRTTRYCTTLAEVEGMPAAIFNATDDDPKEDYLPGHPWEMMRAWPDNPHATFYCMLDDQNDMAAAVEHIRQDISKLFNARLLNVVEQHEWAYFPHVSRESLQNGYFDQLETLQGKNHTHYCGALLAFETVENVVAYSHTLINRHFK